MIYEDYNSVKSVEVVMLKGDKGDVGPQGERGPIGETGLSAPGSGTIGQGYCVCDTPEPTPTKVASLSGYTLTPGTIVSVKFVYSVYASGSTQTLNINSTGAVPIYFRDAALRIDNIINAGDVVTFMYSQINNSENYCYRIISLDPGASKSLVTTSTVSGIVWKTRKAATSSVNNYNSFGITECWTSSRITYSMQAGTSTDTRTIQFPSGFFGGTYPCVYVTAYAINDVSAIGTLTYEIVNVSNASVTIKFTRSATHSSGAYAVNIKAEN